MRDRAARRWIAAALLAAVGSAGAWALAQGTPSGPPSERLRQVAAALSDAGPPRASAVAIEGCAMRVDEALLADCDRRSQVARAETVIELGSVGAVEVSSLRGRHFVTLVDVIERPVDLDRASPPTLRATTHLTYCDGSTFRGPGPVHAVDLAMSVAPDPGALRDLRRHVDGCRERGG